MKLTLESVEEFRGARRSLLLGGAELSSLKLEVEAEALASKKPKKRGRRALDTPHSTSPAKKKKGERDDTVISVSPAKRKVAQGTDISTIPTKKTKGL